ncbi:hypothetical protein Dda_7424 [Drechslerella dactyloides]|uniref:Uncharacterized protein n=1 Tax=Drechslerella dactyloides TaxID=74499 RepID=A0AAD6IWG1_DREDA|nr:hypothetical protein Dda_7424 [Drechslerella dactyloides]
MYDTLRDDKVLQELYTTKAELDATISTSELGSPSFKSHVSAMVAVRKQIGTRKEYLKRHLLAQERQEFFDRCDSLDINAQIEEQNDQNLSGTTEGPAMEEDSSQQASITRPSRLKVIERIKSDYPTNSIDPILVNRFLEYINDATWSDEAKRYKKKKKTEYRRALASQAKGSALVTDAKGMRAKRNYESAEGSSLEEDQTDYGTARPSEMDGLDIINCYQNSAQQAYTILIGDQGAGRRWENISEIVKIAARLDVQQRVSTSAKCVIEGADSLVEYFLRRAHYVERSSARKYKKQIWRNAGDVKETAGDDSPENTATV